MSRRSNEECGAIIYCAKELERKMAPLFTNHCARYSRLPGDRALRAGVILCLFAALLGCAISREPTRTPRTAIEELLLSSAVQRSMNALNLPISPVESVA